MEGVDAPTLSVLQQPQFGTASGKASATFALSFRPCWGHGPGGWARREDLPAWALLGKPGAAAAKTGAMRRPPENGEAASEEGIGGWGLWGQQETRRLGCAVRIWESGCGVSVCTRMLWDAGGEHAYQGS